MLSSQATQGENTRPVAIELLEDALLCQRKTEEDVPRLKGSIFEVGHSVIEPRRSISHLYRALLSGTILSFMV